jgi:hypothetical protein
VSWRESIRERIAPAESPLPLALLRVAVAAVILASPEPQTALLVSQRAADLRIAPEGLTWLGTIVPLTPAGVLLAHGVLRGAGVLLLLGALTRLSAVLALASFVYLFGAAQLTGTVLHDMHLGWMLVLLAVGPAADVLSIDAWAQGRPPLAAPPTRAAGVSLTFARLLLGLVYVFPGLRKITVGGGEWIASDNLRNQMWFKWFEAGGIVPWPRIDRSAFLCSTAAVAVIAFECGFLFFALSKRKRWVAIAGGLLFHASVQHFLYVRFTSLWALYVALLDGDALMTTLRRWAPGRRLLSPSPAAEEPRARAVWPIAIAGSALALGVLVQGARGKTQSWPFACYPTFEDLAPSTIVDLAIEAEVPGETRHVLRPSPARPAADWGMTWRLLGLYGDGVVPARLEAYAQDLAARDGEGAMLARAARVRFFAERYDLDPARYGAAPVERRVVYER